jgi:hypothetical protein
LSVASPSRADAGAHSVPREPVLGRSVVVAPGQDPPAAWERCGRAGGGIEELEQAMGAVWYYADTNPAMSTMGCRTLRRIVADTPI